MRLELGGVGFYSPRQAGQCCHPQGEEGRPREAALAQGPGEEGGGMFYSASREVGFASSPPTCSLLFPLPFSTGPGGHRPRDLKLGGSFLLRNFRKKLMMSP